MGKLPRTKSGNFMMLVCVDAFSKFVWLIPALVFVHSSGIKQLPGNYFKNISVLKYLQDSFIAGFSHFRFTVV